MSDTLIPSVPQNLLHLAYQHQRRPLTSLELGSLQNTMAYLRVNPTTSSWGPPTSLSLRISLEGTGSLSLPVKFALLLSSPDTHSLSCGLYTPLSEPMAHTLQNTFNLAYNYSGMTYAF
jgi:hypothetical protein